MAMTMYLRQLAACGFCLAAFSVETGKKTSLKQIKEAN